MNKLKLFLRKNSGATAIEYAIIASVIGLAIVAGMNGLSNNALTVYNKISSVMAIARPVEPAASSVISTTDGNSSDWLTQNHTATLIDQHAPSR